MAGSVRYRDGDNSVLRLVLYNRWQRRCYWCQRPKDFNDIEIDHILPRDASAKQLATLKHEYGLHKDFDLDDPENLAPICSVCNGRRGKGMKEYGPKPIVMGQLHRARELRPIVIEQVQNFGNSRRVAEHLLRASETDLSDPKARQAFEEHAPVIVQKLALLDERKADYLSFSIKSVAIGHGPSMADGSSLEIGISLNSRARTAKTILEEVCGCAVDDVLEEHVSELVSMIHRNTHTAFERIEGPAGPTISGPPVGLRMRIDIDSIDYTRSARSIEFPFNGHFDALLVASLVQDRWDGIGLNEIQGDAQVAGTFSFAVTWDFSTELGDVHTGECWIESWDAQVG